MKKMLLGLFFCVLFASKSAFAQIAAGTYTIPGDYNTIADAVTALNTQGISGRVTFNVAAGYTETAPTGGVILGSTTLNATLSSVKTLTIQKFGVGANPVITAPVGTSTTVDGIFILQGVDFTTIDGIDLKESIANTTATTLMEWGYSFVNLDATDGCQGNTIQNCTITFTKLVNNIAIGINFGHYLATSNTALTIATTSGLHNDNKVYSNTIIGSLSSAINFTGYAAASPYTFFDQNNDIGGTDPSTGNTIVNFGGLVGGSFYITNYALFALYQNNANISYNTVTFAPDGLGCVGIYAFGTNSTFTCNNNKLTAAGGLSYYGSSTSFSTHVGIYSNAAGTNLTANNNTINWAISGLYTGTVQACYGINFPGTGNFTATNNNISVSQSASGALYGVLSGSTGLLNISTDTIKLTNPVATNGLAAAIYQSAKATSETIQNNNFAGSTLLSSGTNGVAYLIYDNNATNDRTITGNYVSSTITHSSTSTGNTFGYYCATATAPTGGRVLIANNNFSNITKSGTGAFYGIYYGPTVATTQTYNISNNTVSNIYNASAATIFGIYHLSGTTDSLYANNISSLTAGSAVYGIFSGSTNTVTSHIYKNKIYSLLSTGVSGVTYGITIAAGTSVDVFNNLIGDLKATASTGTTDVVRGINITSTTALTSINVYYNTVYLNAVSTGTNFSTTGIYHTTSATATTAALSLRNNIIFNSSTPNGTGLSVAYRRSSTALNNYAATSNNNLFYAGIPSVNSLIFYDGTNAVQTLAAYKTTVATTDAASVTGTPPFINTTDGSLATYLHLNTTLPTVVESGAVNISGITDDFDGNIRQGNVGYTGTGTAPDLGAVEFNGIAVIANDIAATAFVTPVNGSTLLLGSNFTPQVTYTNNGSVNQTNVTVRYKIIDGSNNAVYNQTVTIASLASGSTTSVSFPSASISNVGNYSIVAIAELATDQFRKNDTIIGGISIAAALCGNYHIGASQAAPFNTLSNAVNRLNSVGASCAVSFLLDDANYSTNETFPIVINAFSGSSSTNTLTIKPNVGVNPIISGTVSNNALIKTLASNVLIDGSNTDGGTTKNLTIKNNSTGVPYVVHIGSTGATPIANVNVKNITIVNGSNAAGYALVLSDGASIATAGYFNNDTIQNCSIQSAYFGVFAIGTALSGNGTGLLVAGNDLSSSGANAIRNVGIYLQGVDGAIVSNNLIGNFETASAETDKAVWLATSTINTTVSNNTISNLGYTGTSTYSPYAIHVSSVVTASNNNIIGNSITGITSSGTGTSSGIYVSGATGGITLQKNKIRNIKNSNNSGYGSNGIWLASTSTTANINVNNNFVSDIASYGYPGTTSALGASVTDNGYGIVVASGAGYNIYHNTVLLNTNQTINGKPAAINITSGVTAAGAINLQNNIFATTQTSPSVNTYAIFVGAAKTVFGTIDNNDYYTTGDSLSNNVTTFAVLQTVLGSNTNSLNIAPVFTSATDLHLVQSSLNAALDNKGTPIASVTTDIDNEARSVTTPDMGADEFTSNLLPVTLISFYGNKQADGNKLYWSTANEINNNGFELEHSSDGVSFSLVTFVPSKANNGSSTNTLTYNYTDALPFAGNNYYRLKQIDVDGRYVYSPIVLIKAIVSAKFDIVSIYPNPVVGSNINLALTSSVNDNVTVVVTDVMGKLVVQKSAQINIGDNVIALDVSQLATGNYTIRAFGKNGTATTTQKFIKQ